MAHEFQPRFVEPTKMRSVLALVVVIALSLAFAMTIGLQDAANAIAALVATRGARPGSAVLFASGFSMLGSFLPSTAVAATIAALVDVSATEELVVLGAAVTAATAFDLVAWRMGIPASGTHAIAGALAGAALAVGGSSAVNWGGVSGLQPRGIAGVLVALAVSPFIGFGVGYTFDRAARWLLRRATSAVNRPIRIGQWASTATLAFSQCANDAQKAMGLIAAALVGTGHLSTFAIPFWVRVLGGGALTLGTLAGGWRIARTIGRGIYRIGPLDGLVCESGTTGVVLASSLVGAPVSTTQVLAASVVGVGASRKRYAHVRWRVVRHMLLAWVITLPTCGLLAAALVPVWRWLT
jgi:PiT family inorganic phosphate transporter